MSHVTLIFFACTCIKHIMVFVYIYKYIYMSFCIRTHICRSVFVYNHKFGSTENVGTFTTTEKWVCRYNKHCHFDRKTSGKNAIPSIYVYLEMLLVKNPYLRTVFPLTSNVSYTYYTELSVADVSGGYMRRSSSRKRFCTM